MSLLSRGLAAVAALWLLLAVADAGAAGFRPLPATTGAIATDGSRYLAYTRADGTTRVVDERTRTTFDVATPASCDTVRAIGGGQLAWRCSRPERHNWPGDAMLLDLRTRTVHEPAGLEALAEEWHQSVFYFAASWYEVGSQWLLGTEQSVAHSATQTRSIALNWRTGEYRRDEPQGARVVPNPNRAGLTRKLCTPLRRDARSTGSLESETPPFLDFQYARPYGVAQVERRRDDDSITYSAVLGRCGSRRTIELGPYSRSTVQVGAGYVTWVEGRYAHARALRSGAQRRWKLPADTYMLLHTGRRLYALAGRLGRARLHTTSLR